MTKIDREQLAELLSAYIDGELGGRETELVERVLRKDESARRLLDEFRQTVRLVSSLPRHPAPTSIAEDVQLRVERSELLGDAYESRASGAGHRTPLLGLLSTAAVLCLIVGGVWFMTQERSPETGPREDVVALGSRQPGDEYLTELEEAGAGPAHKGRGGPATPEKTARSREDAAEELIALADLEQKWRAGLGVEAVRTHTFRNETVQLRVPVRDKAERDAVAARLVAFLSEHHAADLAKAASGVSKTATPTSSSYYEGDPGMNFVEEDQRQILVRASRRELDELMGELANTAVRQKAVEMSAGPLTVRGLKTVQAAVYVLGGAAPNVPSETVAGTGDAYVVSLADEKPSDTASEPSGEAATGDKGLWEGFFKVLPVDPRKLVVDTKKSEAPAERARGVASRAEADRGAGHDAEGRSADLVRSKGEKKSTVVANEALDTDEPSGEARADKRDRATRRSAKTKESAGGTPHTFLEPPSLVTRRMRALEGIRRARPEISETPTASPGAIAEGAAEPYVTLVVTMIIEKPESARSAGPAKTPQKSSRKSSRESTDQPPSDKK